MKFIQVLEQFRALGGIAENIELRYGSFGRGIFPVNPALSVKIVTPSKLLISSERISLNKENKIRINAKLDPLIINFFENYQQFFGWGDGGLDEVSKYHIELCMLPKKIKQLLLMLGWAESDFDHKKNKDYLLDYLISRQIRISDKSVIMPIMELINHSEQGKSYIADNGVKIEGVFNAEVLAKYHGNFDAFHFFKNYRFVSASDTVLSCDVKIALPKIGLINISRFDRDVETKDGQVIPKIIRKRSEIRISFLEIANEKSMVSSKQKFIEQMRDFEISTAELSNIFNGLVTHNIKVREDLIAECKLCLYKMARDLESIAQSQINTLRKISGNALIVCQS